MLARTTERRSAQLSVSTSISQALSGLELLAAITSMHSPFQAWLCWLPGFIRKYLSCCSYVSFAAQMAASCSDCLVVRRIAIAGSLLWLIAVPDEVNGKACRVDDEDECCQKTDGNSNTSQRRCQDFHKYAPYQSRPRGYLLQYISIVSKARNSRDTIFAGVVAVLRLHPQVDEICTGTEKDTKLTIIHGVKQTTNPIIFPKNIQSGHSLLRIRGKFPGVGIDRDGSAPILTSLLTVR